jgi:hypothetical protein
VARYWQRVRSLAAAAGYVPGPSDPHFQKLVAERVAAGNPEREDSPTYLLKRLKQLEQENAALRQKKRSRPEDAAAELKELVTELKHRSCAPDFPVQCAAALERISALIEDASDRGSFGLAQSTAEGKALVRIRARRGHDQARARRAAAPARALPLGGAPGSRGPPTPHAISTRLWPPSAPRAGPRTRRRS